MMTWRTLLVVAFSFSLPTIYAQELSDVDASKRADAAQTLLQSIGALRTTYTADIEMDSPDLAEVEKKPVFSYKQRIFDDGTADFQATMEHFQLPKEIPAALSMDGLSVGFLSTSDITAIHLDDTAVVMDSRSEEMEKGLRDLMEGLNDIPMPSDEELAAMDLQQELEIIDGVECQVLTWIPEEYEAGSADSVAMHCVAFGVEDHFLRSYTALNEDGEPLFSLRFTNINLNPSFGPDDFVLPPNLNEIHVKTPEQFASELRLLFLKKFVQNVLKPKPSKRRRHTSSATPPPPPSAELATPQEPTPAPTTQPPEPPPNEAPDSGKLPFYLLSGTILIAIIILLLILAKTRKE